MPCDSLCRKFCCDNCRHFHTNQANHMILNIIAIILGSNRGLKMMKIHQMKVLSYGFGGEEKTEMTGKRRI